MSVVNRTSLRVGAKHKTKHSKVLRRRVDGRRGRTLRLHQKGYQALSENASAPSQNEPAWLGLSVVIEANLQVVSITNETHHLRDSWLLESALAKPRNRFLYGGGLSRRDLEPLIGTRTRVAEVLNR